MLEETRQLKKDLQGVQGHIFYYFEDTNKYVENAVAYIMAGIEQGGQVFVAENSRLYCLIQDKLQSLLNSEQMNRICYSNNFDFYFSKGTFHPEALMKHCRQAVDSLVEKEVPVRTWGHIEWGKEHKLDREIEIYEKKLDQMLFLDHIASVCAYDASRVSESLKRTLLESHEFFMTDDEIMKV
ncbi:MEDS domain-containing protein [Domibacillus robiginosus]|uniref:MEDS domain-containing protein n=1 Tax=Domibacillus robiginosus TaxID=1071054 RepID=UPI00067CA8C8|nr:MEDS domain-containing protein [Domibacillus robiginosus]